MHIKNQNNINKTCINKTCIIILSYTHTDTVSDCVVPAFQRYKLPIYILTNMKGEHYNAIYTKNKYEGCHIVECDVFNPNQVIESINYLEYSPASIFSNSDRLQLSCSIAANYFNLPGKDMQACFICKNKFAMRQALGNIAENIKHILIKNSNQFDMNENSAQEIIIEQTMIAKPVYGIASENIAMINNIQELNSYISENNFDILLEEYCEGHLYTLETIGDGQNIHILCGGYTPIEHGDFMEKQRLYCAKPQYADRVIEILQSINVSFGICHTEYIITHDNKLKILEINYRACGSKTEFVVNAQMNNNIWDAVADLYMTGKFDANLYKKYAGYLEWIIPKKDGYILSIDSEHCDIKKGYKVCFIPMKAIYKKFSIANSNRDFLGIVYVIADKNYNTEKLQSIVREKIKNINNNIYIASNLKYENAIKIAEFSSIKSIINCFLRSYCISNNLLILHQRPNTSQEDNIANDNIANYIDIKDSDYIFEVNLDCIGISLFFTADRIDNISFHKYTSDIWCKYHKNNIKGHNVQYKKLDLYDIAKIIFDFFNIKFNGIGNNNFIQEVVDSGEMQKQICLNALNYNKEPYSSYIESEQSLYFGHTAHPSPKLRTWPSKTLSYNQYSPEFHQSFRLNDILFYADYTHILSSSKMNDFMQYLSPNNNDKHDGIVIGMHPVESEIFLKSPKAHQMIESGHIKDLGPIGYEFSPTISMRTLYSYHHDFFIKSSLSLYITNAIRRHSWFELFISQLIYNIIRPIAQGFIYHSIDADIVNESASVFWSPTKDYSNMYNSQELQWYAEHTGLIFRENFCKKYGHDNIIVAASLAAINLNNESNITRYLNHYYQYNNAMNNAKNAMNNAIHDEIALSWFASYTYMLIKPVFYMFFIHKLAVEPHLQNIVIVHNQGQIVKILFRDYEGMKITDKLLLNNQYNIHSDVENHVLYTPEDAWKRLTYCLFVNNISEMMLAISYNNPIIKNKLQDVLMHSIKRASQELDIVKHHDIQALINNRAVYNKDILITRIHNQLDHYTQYTSFTLF